MRIPDKAFSTEDSTINLGRSQEPTPKKFEGKLEKTVSEVKQQKRSQTVSGTSHSLHGMNNSSFTSARRDSTKKWKAGCDGKTLTSRAAAECVAHACNPTTERQTPEAGRAPRIQRQPRLQCKTSPNPGREKRRKKKERKRTKLGIECGSAHTHKQGQLLYFPSGTVGRCGKHRELWTEL